MQLSWLVEFLRPEIEKDDTARAMEYNCSQYECTLTMPILKSKSLWSSTIWSSAHPRDKAEKYHQNERRNHFYKIAPNDVCDWFNFGGDDEGTSSQADINTVQIKR